MDRFIIDLKHLEKEGNDYLFSMTNEDFEKIGDSEFQKGDVEVDVEMIVSPSDSCSFDFDYAISYNKKTSMTHIKKTLFLYILYTFSILTSCASEPELPDKISMMVSHEMSLSDKLYLYNLYNQYKNDSILQSPIVKENKDEFTRIIKEDFETDKNLNNYDSTKNTYIQIAHRHLQIINNSDDEKEIVIAALTASFDESISHQMEHFAKEAKPIYVSGLIESCELERNVPFYEREYHSPKFDSISYALGYRDGMNLRKSLSSYHIDEYEFVEGLRIGHRIAISGVDINCRGIWDQVLQLVNSRPASFTIGMTTGIEGAQKLCEVTYIAGAFYGETGKRPKWKIKEMEEYLIKNPKVERNVSTFEFKLPIDVKEAIEKKLSGLR
ncbi:MAG: hypothetical protein UH850_01665 [Paludibacteraceae bacterium]|nr:hypothetical protein [Paludibacteraceae bacterium]